jgi:hypothetical protein
VRSPPTEEKEENKGQAQQAVQRKCVSQATQAGGGQVNQSRSKTLATQTPFCSEEEKIEVAHCQKATQTLDASEDKVEEPWPQHPAFAGVLSRKAEKKAIRRVCHELEGRVHSMARRDGVFYETELKNEVLEALFRSNAVEDWTRLEHAHREDRMNYVWDLFRLDVVVLA